ncbi:Uncharacterized protein DBV15_10650 [Temnothorax longispinosus]|uniref:Uncharacterized protein n=1 Tax=Temnothorax longispinosus TaxID=300112 RepID=A0A4S2JML6_9HYME|nr:Uncharacterized protein DBV15_10650 [Temnothorax longispinosus]
MENSATRGSAESTVKRDIAKKLISRLTVSRYPAILRLERVLNNGVAGVSRGRPRAIAGGKVQVEYPLNVPVLISAELAAPRRGSRQLVRGGRRGTNVPKSPVNSCHGLANFAATSDVNQWRPGWCLVLAGHPVHTPHLPGFTARRLRHKFEECAERGDTAGQRVL